MTLDDVATPLEKFYLNYATQQRSGSLAIASCMNVRAGAALACNTLFVDMTTLAGMGAIPDAGVAIDNVTANAARRATASADLSPIRDTQLTAKTSHEAMGVGKDGTTSMTETVSTENPARTPSGAGNSTSGDAVKIAGPDPADPIESRIPPPNNGISSWVRGFFKKFFSPLTVPKTVKAVDVAKQTGSDIKAMKKLGLTFHQTIDTTYLDSNVNIWEKTGIQTSRDHPNADYGQILQIDTLPPSGKAIGPNTNAFLHPEMATYKAKLESMGYRLVVDTSTPFTGASAYQWSWNKVVALRPDTTWQTFLHEFQHAEFDTYLKRRFPDLQAAAKSGTSLFDALPEKVVSQIGAARIKRLEGLLQKELPELAVNETLSVDEELRVMGFRRYIPMIGTGSEKYALRHQITELNDIVETGGTLTAVQARTLAQAKIRYAALLANDFGGGAAVLGVLGGAEVGGLKYLQKKQNDPNSYLQIVYDKEGHVLGQKPDGTWVYLKSP